MTFPTSSGARKISDLDAEKGGGVLSSIVSARGDVFFRLRRLVCAGTGAASSPGLYEYTYSRTEGVASTSGSMKVHEATVSYRGSGLPWPPCTCAAHTNISMRSPAVFESAWTVKTHEAPGSMIALSGVMLKTGMGIFTSASGFFLSLGGGMVTWLTHVSTCGRRPLFSSVNSSLRMREEKHSPKEMLAMVRDAEIVAPMPVATRGTTTSGAYLICRIRSLVVLTVSSVCAVSKSSRFSPGAMMNSFSVSAKGPSLLRSNALMTAGMSDWLSRPRLRGTSVSTGALPQSSLGCASTTLGPMDVALSSTWKAASSRPTMRT